MKRLLPPRGEEAWALYLPAAAVLVRVVREAGEVVAARNGNGAHADKVRGEKLGVQGVNAVRGKPGAELDEDDF